MSHSGNDAARRLRGLPPGGGGPRKPTTLNTSTTTIKEEQLYNPSVFRYKCIGYLHLNSDQKGSPGTCHGLQGRVERVANMVPDTRDAAIQKFLDAASDLGTYVDSDDSNADQKVKEIYTSRTMIYKDENRWQTSDPTKKENKIQPVKSSPFPEEDLIDKTEWNCYGSTQVHYLVLDPVQVRKTVTTTKSGDDPEEVVVEEVNATAGKGRPSSLFPRDPNLPPEFAEMFDNLSKHLEEFDKQIQGEFFGDKKTKKAKDSTENDDNNNNNNNNKSDDDKTAKENKDSNASTDEETNSNNKKIRRPARRSHVHREVVTHISTSGKGQGKICAITPENIGLSVRKIDSAVGHFTVADIGSIRICLETSGSLMGDDGDKKTNRSSNNKSVHDLLNPNGMKPAAINSTKDKEDTKDNKANPGIDEVDKTNAQKTMEHLKKFYNFTIKVGQQMEYNVHEIKEALSDDFPGRTVSFGHKVVNRMETTTEQSYTYMKKIIDSWWKSM